MQRLPSPQSKLEKHAREFFLHHNRSIAKVVKVGTNALYTRESLSLRNRMMMMMVILVTMNCIVVLYHMTEGGPTKKERKYEVFFGNVAKLTYERRRQVGSRLQEHTFTKSLVRLHASGLMKSWTARQAAQYCIVEREHFI